MRIYRLRHASCDNPKFAYAMGFNPLPGDMPFLFEIEMEHYRKYCEVKEKGPPGIQIGGGGGTGKGHAMA